MRTRRSMERIETLRTIRLFRGCSDKELARVDSLLDEIRAEPGAVLTREGSFGQESYVIVAGSADVTIEGRLVATLGPGDFFGEMAVLGKEPVRAATVTAATPMELLVIEPGTMGTLLEIGSIASVMLKGVVDRLGAAQAAGA